MTMPMNRRMWCLCTIVWALMAAADVNAQLVFPAGQDVLTTETGAFETDVPVIIDGSGKFVCRWIYKGPQLIFKGVYKVGFFEVSPFPGLTELGIRIVLEDGNGKRIVLALADFEFHWPGFADVETKGAR